MKYPKKLNIYFRYLSFLSVNGIRKSAVGYIKY